MWCNDVNNCKRSHNKLFNKEPVPFNADNNDPEPDQHVFNQYVTHVPENVLAV